MNKFTDFIVKQKFLLISLNLAFVIFLTFFIQKKEIDSSPEIWFLDNDPAIQSFNLLKENFDNDEFLVLYYKTDKTIFTQKILSSIDSLTQTIASFEYVTEIFSITNYRFLESEDEVLEAKLLFPQFDDGEIPTNEEINFAKEKALKDEMLTKSLLKPDGKGALIFVKIEYKPNVNADYKIDLVKKIYEEVEKEKEKTGCEILATGGPVVQWELMKTLFDDLKVVFPFSTLILFAVVLFLFRSFAGLALTMSVVYLSILGTLGFIGIFDWAYTSLNISVSTILMAIGIADSIHFLSAYIQALARFEEEAIEQSKIYGKAVSEAVKKVFLPCWLTTLTTAIGFITLSQSHLRPLKEFGFEVAFGVFLALVLTLTFMPALILIFKPKFKKCRNFFIKKDTLTIYEKLVEFSYKNRKIIVLISLITVIVSVFGISKLKVESSFLDYISEDHPARKWTETIQNELGSTVQIDFLAQVKNGKIQDKKVLEELAKFEDFLASLAGVKEVVSVGNLIERTNFELNNREEGFAKIPDEQSVLDELFYLVEGFGGILETLVNSESDLARVSARTIFMDSAQYNVFMAQVNEYVSENISQFEIMPTGLMVMFKNMEYHLLWSMVDGFLWALGFIILLIGLAFRSVKFALFSLIPNLVPILITFGLMGFLGIKIDVGTSLIACITLGIIVDDTIHFLEKLKKAKETGKSNYEATLDSMRISGRAIFFTSVILILVFSSLVVSVWIPTVYMGILCSLTIFSALIADLIITPAAMFFFEEKRKSMAS